MRLERVPRGEDPGETREDFHTVGRGAKDAASLPGVAGCLLEVRFTNEDAGVPERVCHGLTVSSPHARYIITTWRAVSIHCASASRCLPCGRMLILRLRGPA